MCAAPGPKAYFLEGTGGHLGLRQATGSSLCACGVSGLPCPRNLLPAACCPGSGPAQGGSSEGEGLEEGASAWGPWWLGGRSQRGTVSRAAGQDSGRRAVDYSTVPLGPPCHLGVAHLVPPGTREGRCWCPHQ